jgi:hypothetical protein
VSSLLSHFPLLPVEQALPQIAPTQLSGPSWPKRPHLRHICPQGPWGTEQAVRLLVRRRRSSEQPCRHTRGWRATSTWRRSRSCVDWKEMIWLNHSIPPRQGRLPHWSRQQCLMGWWSHLPLYSRRVFSLYIPLRQRGLPLSSCICSQRAQPLSPSGVGTLLQTRRLAGAVAAATSSTSRPPRSVLGAPLRWQR